MRGRGHIQSVGTGLDSLAHLFSAQLGRTVVNKTDLKGNFDYKLDWTPDDAGPSMNKGGDPAPSESANTSDSAGPSLFTALQEQLGLKLGSVKTQADVIVIDQIEQPRRIEEAGPREQGTEPMQRIRQFVRPNLRCLRFSRRSRRNRDSSW